MSFRPAALFSGVIVCTAWVLTGPGLAHPGAGAPVSVDGVLARIGAYVGRYYATAQRLVAVETVTLQPLRADLSSAEFPRRLEYDLRVEWTPSADGLSGEAEVHRTLVKVNGRPPRPKDEPGCSDPRSVSPEPLAMFLPGQQPDYAFTPLKPGRVGGRAALMIDYRPLTKGAVQITWHDDCVSIELPGRSVGRVWADPESGEVLRVDEHLIGMYDIPVPAAQQRKGGAPSMTLERSDSSIRYRPVRFHDPDETVLLPAEVETLTVFRDAGIPRMRIRQVFSNYRRFVTEGRILGD